MAGMPSIYVKKFVTRFKPDPKDPGQLIGVDWVEYGPLGGLDRTLNVATVTSLLDKLQPLDDAQNPSVIMAHERAAIIRREYDAWKAGKEPVVNGTPLAAWNAVNSDQVEILNRVGIKSVEDVAALTDASAARVGLPNRNELIRLAKNFLESKDQTRLANKLTEKDAAIDALSAEAEDAKNQMAAMRAQMDEMQAAFTVATAGQEPVEEEEKPRYRMKKR